jgi:hypothetical protein
MDPELAGYLEYLGPSLPSPIPGQPGLFGSLHAAAASTAPAYNPPKVFKLPPGWASTVPKGKLHGFGDAAAVQSMLVEADTRFAAVKANAAKLLQMYGPLELGVIQRIKNAIAGKGAGGWYAQMGAAEFAGIIRFFLSGVATSVSLVHALMNGPSPEAQVGRAVAILVPAMGVLTAVERLVSTAQATEAAIRTTIQTLEGAARSIAGRLGLGELGFEPVEIAAGVIVAFVIVSVLFLGFQQYEAMQGASEAATQACSTPPPCTHAEWASLYQQALAAGSNLTILANLGHVIDQGGSLLFWGGLLAVAGVLAYGAWVAAPAAATTRARLTARAQAL